MEALWRTYYGAVFNPARLNLKAMRAEMPVRHWTTLPEAQMLPSLVAAAPQRVRGMLNERAPAPTARPFVPDTADLEKLRAAAAACTGCALHAPAPPGKRRIHQTPRYSEIRACRPWVEAEIASVQPRLIVCLGATAAKALLGPQFRLTKERGRLLDSPWGSPALATWHPSAVLRADQPAHADELLAQLIADLTLAARHVGTTAED
ncbi:MAG: DUF4130 domain-containing protein [Vicinamibacteraceae bacterium]